MTHHIAQICGQIRAHRPLIHCITNPISIQPCANALLAVGARPIMAEHPGEVCEITGTAQALLLNLGNITDVRMESMRLSAQTARKGQIPVVLDAVGTACSTLRREYARGLIALAAPAVIKGNYSEIAALHNADYRSAGVDADAALQTQVMDCIAAELAQKYQAVILASGPVDIVTDGTRLIHIKNGTPQLAGVTGTGCVLGALSAACLTAGSALPAAVAACALLGICGQRVETSRGSGSFLVQFMDALSTLTVEEIAQMLDMEEIGLETY